MAVQEGVPKAVIAAQLTAMSVAVLAGMLFMGAFATRLVQRGLNLERLYRGTMGLALVVLAAMLAWPKAGGLLVWPLLGLCSSFNNIAYTLMSQSFPATFAGRANTALNMVILAGAFCLQWGLGALVDAFHGGGLDTGDAYRSSFALLASGQVLALIWLAARPSAPAPLVTGAAPAVPGGRPGPA